MLVYNRMAFNLNFYKGTTASQAQNALQYWMTALKSKEEVEQLKMEKQKMIEENAVVYPEGPVGVAEVASEPIGPCGPTGTNNLIEQ
jgi:hypothetical protein